MGVEGIPNEVLLLTMEYMSKAPKESDANKSWGFEALRNARLVCRRWNQAAMLALFRILHLRYVQPPPGTGSLSSPGPVEHRSQNAGFQRWQRIMSLYIARSMVKLVIIDSPHSPSRGDEAGWLWYNWEERLDSDFTGAVNHISRLPNLNAVEVHFGPRAILNNAPIDDWAVYQYMYFEYLHFCRNIKHLHLHVKEWGTVPCYFSGCGLLFPVLETLHLRFFTISHDDHLDWVLRMPALKRLYLAETKMMTLASCNLAVAIRWDIPTHDWKQLPHGAYGFSGQQDSIFEYPRRWSYFFNRIKSELGRLSDFRISWSSPHRPVWYDGKKAPWTEVPKSTVSMDSFVERYAALRFGFGKDHAG
ncbi:hypothetical protein B0T11DRAFT_296099 [Plectosphaerella cucumerina]|uniref:F-box domain-containing protein n=1 Tax=Plectosphaerella cucumerina TaxID=40658 RepID=A0A8K0TKF1_9PEZI|nr:hypothetical protein B0T11DRAFT_296099 [Plectosphaerella cucumerina]